MYIIDEREQEYNRMYSYVMRNSNRMLLTTDEIIEYLVCQCYYIESYNDNVRVHNLVYTNKMGKLKYKKVFTNNH